MSATAWQRDVTEWLHAQGELRRQPGYRGLCRVCQTPVLESHEPVDVFGDQGARYKVGVIHGAFPCIDEDQCDATLSRHRRGPVLRQVCILPITHPVDEHLFGAPR